MICSALFSSFQHRIILVKVQYPQASDLWIQNGISSDVRVTLLSYRVVPGRSDSSWGLVVAKASGIPDEIIHDAELFATRNRQTDKK